MSRPMPPVNAQAQMSRVIGAGELFANQPMS